jgi:phage FluMu gp28-like protein
LRSKSSIVNIASGQSSSGRPQGDYFVGVDLGKKQDPTVIALLKKTLEALRLLGLKVFPLETDYTAIIGYLHVLTSKIQTVHKVLIDQTGVGESFLDEAKKSIPNIDGQILSQPAKQDVMNYLKLTMQQKRLEIPYQLELVNELNVERFELTKTGQIQFSHPAGSHDDRLWAVALAVFATKTTPFPQLKRSHTTWIERK